MTLSASEKSRRAQVAADRKRAETCWHLRRWASWNSLRPNWRKTLAEAADRIETAEKRVAELEAEREEREANIGRTYDFTIAGLNIRISELKTECEALAAAAEVPD